MWQKIKCYFGFHSLVVSLEEQKRLDDAMKTPFGKFMQLDTLSNGKKIVFKICKHCGKKI